MSEEGRTFSAMRELPDTWGAGVTDDGFSAAVSRRLARRRRHRSAAVAIAGSLGGSVGCTMASAQFLGAVNSEPVVAAAALALAPLQGLVSPENLLALFMAAIAGSVAWVLPNRV